MCKLRSGRLSPRGQWTILCILMLTRVLRMATWVHKGTGVWDCIKEMNVTTFPILHWQQQPKIRERADSKHVHSHHKKFESCYPLSNCSPSCKGRNMLHLLCWSMSPHHWHCRGKYVFHLPVLWNWKSADDGDFFFSKKKQTCILTAQVWNLNFSNLLGIYSITGIGLSVVVVCPVKCGHSLIQSCISLISVEPLKCICLSVCLGALASIFTTASSGLMEAFHCLDLGWKQQTSQ